MVLAHNIEAVERTQDVQITQGVTFESMLLAVNTLEGLKNSGFCKPSPIQLHGIPLGKCGFDLLLEAKSGTGKTAVFSIIALEQLDKTKGMQTVILTPTREIAAQVCDVIRQIGSQFEGLNVEVFIGGLPVEEDIAKLKNGKVNILVGSPGRVRHLIQQKYIDISSIRLLVLDEADKLLEKSFIVDINYIFSVSPKQKQVIMSSATYSDETQTFVKKYVRNAHHVCPDSNSVLLGVAQKVTVVKNHSNIVTQTGYRFEELLKILSKYAFKQCLVFCNYQARVGELHKMLKTQKWPAEQLCGQQEQVDRLNVLKSLQEYNCRILISTDLASRGIDASNVDLVINFEPPFQWQTYLHRIGRAGRFGSYGTAITILSKGKEEQKFSNIMSMLKTPINITNLWEDEQDSTDETISNSQLTKNSMAANSQPYSEMSGECSKLWNLLTRDLKENSDNIEDFEKLCSSFTSSEHVTVESFSELILSLEGHSITNGNNEVYCHLKMQHLSLPQYVQSSTESFIRDPKTIADEVDIKNNNKYGSHFGVNKSAFTMNGHQFKESNKPEINKQACETKNRVSNIELVNNKYTVIDNTEALRMAGLPTAFGSSKGAIRKDKVCQRNDYSQNIKANNGVLYDNYTVDLDTNPGYRKQAFKNRSTESNDKLKTYQFQPDKDSGLQIDDKNCANGHSKFDYCKQNNLFTNKSQTKLDMECGYDVDDENYDNENSVVDDDSKGKRKHAKKSMKYRQRHSENSGYDVDDENYDNGFVIQPMSHTNSQNGQTHKAHNSRENTNQHKQKIESKENQTRSFRPTVNVECVNTNVNYQGFETRTNINFVSGDDDDSVIANYKDWFEQLKHNVAEIQQATYIDELSKLWK